MKGLREKFRKNEGFTMVELLIVVAIIGILAAVSIPMFNNALEKARHGVDQANIRDAISLANAEAIASLNPAKEFGNKPTGSSATDYKGPQTYIYYVNEESNDPNEHQAQLIKKADAAGKEGIKPQCTDTAAKALTGLEVKVFYDPADTGNEFKVMTNWVIGDDGHIEDNTTAFEALGKTTP